MPARNTRFTSSTADIVTTSAASVVTIAKCPTCGVTDKGKLSCCSRGGSWRGYCGDEGEDQEHTWSEGVDACLRKITYLNFME